MNENYTINCKYIWIRYLASAIIAAEAYVATQIFCLFLGLALGLKPDAQHFLPATFRSLSDLVAGFCCIFFGARLFPRNYRASGSAFLFLLGTCYLVGLALSVHDVSRRPTSIVLAIIGGAAGTAWFFWRTRVFTGRRSNQIPRFFYDKYSTFEPRFWAAVIDSLVLLPVGIACTAVFAESTSLPVRILVCVLHSSVYVIYSVGMHSACGQTIGKMVCHVIVLDVSEKPITLRQALLRDIFSIVLFPIGLAIELPRIAQGINIYTEENNTGIYALISLSGSIWFLIELATMLTNNKRRALHDFIAGTVVIFVPQNPVLVPTTRVK